MKISITDLVAFYALQTIVDENARRFFRNKPPAKAAFRTMTACVRLLANGDAVATDGHVMLHATGVHSGADQDTSVCFPRVSVKATALEIDTEDWVATETVAPDNVQSHQMLDVPQRAYIENWYEVLHPATQPTDRIGLGLPVLSKLCAAFPKHTTIDIKLNGAANGQGFRVVELPNITGVLMPCRLKE